MDTTNEKFFNEIYDKTYDDLRAYVKRRSHDAFMADDVLQEVYLEVYRHIDILKAHENPVGWVYKTAQYKVKKLNHLQSIRTLHEMEYPEISDVVSQPAPSCPVCEDCRKILWEDEYSLIMEKYVRGYSYQELAEKRGNSVSAVKMKVFRILKKLRKNYK